MKYLFVEGWYDTEVASVEIVGPIIDQFWIYDDKKDAKYIASLIPLVYEEELIKVLETRKRLKKEFDDSMKLVYELQNKITREGNSIVDAFKKKKI